MQSRWSLIALFALVSACSAPDSAAKPATKSAPASATASAAASQTPQNVATPVDPVDAVLKQEGRLLIDVRTPGEYNSGHVPGSINVPMSRFTEVEKLFKSKDTPAVVFCAVGSRSSQAVRWLQSKGYTKIVNGVGARNMAARLGVPLAR